MRPREGLVSPKMFFHVSLSSYLFTWASPHLPYITAAPKSISCQNIERKQFLGQINDRALRWAILLRKFDQYDCAKLDTKNIWVDIVGWFKTVAVACIHYYNVVLSRWSFQSLLCWQMMQKNYFGLRSLLLLFILICRYFFCRVKTLGERGRKEECYQQSYKQFLICKNSLKMKNVIQFCCPSYISTNYRKLDLQTTH